MIGEYEIPRGSKLYFGETARRKREIETRAAAVFERRGFEEIVTPAFSYHQNDGCETIRFGDESNGSVFLRRDSSLEVARLILKRLGRATEHRKWFYIQPVFRYPTTEIHQIGAESISDGKDGAGAAGEGDLCAMIDVCSEILSGIDAVLQIGSIALLKAIEEELAIDRGILARHEINKLLDRNEKWIKPLLELCDLPQVENVLKQMPDNIAAKLENLAALADKCAWKKKVLSPLFYADMPYYDDLYFRFLFKGEQIALGGKYDSGDARACGFAIYSDKLIS